MWCSKSYVRANKVDFCLGTKKHLATFSYPLSSMFIPLLTKVTTVVGFFDRNILVVLIKKNMRAY